MDTKEASETVKIGFGKMLAKTFAISTAQSAGFYLGLGVILVAAGKVMSVKEARSAKKLAV
jgi:hypothetical protein